MSISFRICKASGQALLRSSLQAEWVSRSAPASHAVSRPVFVGGTLEDRFGLPPSTELKSLGEHCWRLPLASQQPSFLGRLPKKSIYASDSDSRKEDGIESTCHGRALHGVLQDPLSYSWARARRAWALDFRAWVPQLQVFLLRGLFEGWEQFGVSSNHPDS